MMPIINIHPLPSEEKAESFRLTLKDADKFGLYCCTDGISAMWSVIPKIALDLIFNAETALPVTKRPWVGLTVKEIEEIAERCLDTDRRMTVWGLFAQELEEKIREKNT